MTRTTPLDKRLADADADQVRRSHAQAIRELQDLPMSSFRLIRDIVVVNNNPITIAHKLGRAPLFVGVSAIRWDKSPSLAVGTVFDYGEVGPNNEPIDRTQIIVLVPGGFTSAGSVVVTFDLLVG